jgi:hypothetical protein
MPKVGRNEPCPCGSGKKYKRCCLEKNQASEREALATARQARAVSEQVDSKRKNFGLARDR